MEMTQVLHFSMAGLIEQRCFMRALVFHSGIVLLLIPNTR